MPGQPVSLTSVIRARMLRGDIYGISVIVKYRGLFYRRKYPATGDDAPTLPLSRLPRGEEVYRWSRCAG